MGRPPNQAGLGAESTCLLPAPGRTGSGDRYPRAGLGQVEARGIEFATDLRVRPGPHFLVLLVGRVGEDLLELLVAGITADILRRAGAFARGASGVDVSGLGLGARLDEELVLPAVAEVIFLADALAYLGHIGEPHLGLL
jgi:hypothetical protein